MRDRSRHGLLPGALPTSQRLYSGGQQFRNGGQFGHGGQITAPRRQCLICGGCAAAGSRPGRSRSSLPPLPSLRFAPPAPLSPERDGPRT
ncbi:hypothetical protein NSERUTF1_1417 [Nocardia seriolae]|nr:hypothetical protein NSERUTF1_1417 [Nocardia seriolae]